MTRQNRSAPARLRALLGVALVPPALAVLPLACLGSPPERLGSSAAALTLGSAQGFAVLGGSTVTNTGPTTILGDLGVSPGLAITGFPPGIVTGGAVHAGDATAAQAELDVTTAYDGLAASACNTSLTGQDLGGLTLTQGVYCFSSSAQLTGTLVLDAQGDPSAVFIFQIGSALTTASFSAVALINGAQGCNVFWQVGAFATLGSNTAFVGDILALTSITLNTGARVAGRALARNGAVTMDTNDVAPASCAATTDAGVDADRCALVTCAASDQCHTAGVCDPSTGQCSNPHAADGSICDDGDACTQPDTCQAGVCSGANAVVCPIRSECHAAGTCNATTGACSNPCRSAGSSGEPHIFTFDGMFYDFQATGEFILMSAGPSFVVQARQAPASVANTTMNTAAAARLGSDRVAVFASPFTVLVNGAPVTLQSTPLTLPGGTIVAQSGATVTAARPEGKVTFGVVGPLVNVSVHLDPSVTHVTGLFGDKDGNPGNEFVTRSGQRLALPLSFDQLYGVFGASWVVPPAESLFGAQGLLPSRTDGAPHGFIPFGSGEAIAYEPPTRAVKAADFLAGEQGSAAQRACAVAGISDPDLFEACTLDVAVMRDPAAADVFATMEPPELVLRLAEDVGGPEAPSATKAGAGCSVAPGDQPAPRAWWLLAAAALAVSPLRLRRPRPRA